MNRFRTLMFAVCTLAACAAITEARPLKLHAIFTSHMVLQRDKPIVIWGWADGGKKISVRFDDESAEAVADAESGRWEVTFPAREVGAEPLALVVTAGDEKIELDDILIGDVWVANGQSNMAFSMGSTTSADFEVPQANLPLLRHFRIQTNEQATLQTDIRAEAVVNDGWEVSTSETAPGFSAIGYYFGSRVQRALGIPIGVISNARGGASIESMVPAYKFEEDPLAAAYKAYVDQRIADFDPRAKALEKWQNQVNRAKSKGLPEDRWPPKPVDAENLASWDIPGKSPSDAASCYNGMFGVFKGFHIKGVLFHQGYNNAMFSNCRPKRYRVLMKLMVEGWREEFNEPELPVAVIGFCAGGDVQHEDNFEAMSYGGAPFIRESQRLGLADVGDPENTAFLPAYDVQVPGLHPKKKREHGERAARWALAKIYGIGVFWETASLVTAEPMGDEIILTFDWAVTSDDLESIPRGFSVAGEDGKFYMAHARYQAKKDQRNWNNARAYERNIIHVWSPLVEKLVAVRYAWATSPMGNLKVNGHPMTPLPSFRTDDWNWPASDDLEGRAVDRGLEREIKEEAIERCEYRRTEEAKRAVEILERLKTLGRQDIADRL
jgi:sialate O-acetylesterase